MKKLLFAFLIAFSSFTITSCTDEVIAPIHGGGCHGAGCGGSGSEPLPKL